MSARTTRAGCHRASDRAGATPARRVRAYVGLGSNVGTPAATLAAAVAVLASLPGARLRAVSRLYATRPVGVVDQPEFRNAVVALDVPAGPDPATGATALLVALKQIERAFGRRARGRWGPRELDLDLLLFGRARLKVERPPEALEIAPPPGTPSAAAMPPPGPLSAAATPEPHLLVVPHPEAQQRLFVLAPLADLAPGLAPPGWGETVATAARRVRRAERPGAVRVVGRWDPEAGRWRPRPRPPGTVGCKRRTAGGKRRTAGGKRRTAAG